MASRRIRVTGRVQGVSYRDWTRRKALGLGLDGWVRNRRDGSVEALLSGEPARIAEMIEACHEGPRAARVEGVEVLAEDETAEPGFSVLPTA